MGEADLQKQLSENKTSFEQRINDLEITLQKERENSVQLERSKADMEADLRMQSSQKSVDKSGDERNNILEAALEKEKKKYSQLERLKIDLEASLQKEKDSSARIQQEQSSEEIVKQIREKEIIISAR